VNFALAPAWLYRTDAAFNTQANITAARVSINAYLCPSDEKGARNTNYGSGNLSYAISYGWPRYAAGIDSNTRRLTGWTGLAPHNGMSGLLTGTTAIWESYPPSPDSRTASRDVVDGLSKTALFSERLIGEMGVQDSTHRDKRRHVYNDGTDYTGTSGTLRRLVDSCNRVAATSANLVSPNTSRTLGASWMFASLPTTGFWPYTSGSMYAHSQLPNTKSCDPYFAYVCWPNDDNGIAIAASSQHPGGVNICLGDATVQFVSDNVAAEIWWAYGSRDGAEVQQ
jgi:hypothetical protein